MSGPTHTITQRQAALKAAPYASTEYSIISGVRKGTILSRDPDAVAFVQELGKPGGNPMCKDDYIMVTNFDYYCRFRAKRKPTSIARDCGTHRDLVRTRPSLRSSQRACGPGHDIREWFDPTGSKGIGHPRRIEAQKLLNSTSDLTPEFLFSVIDAPGVFADTIFQAVMNVETGLWNVSQPSKAAAVMTAHAAVE